MFRSPLLLGACLLALLGCQPDNDTQARAPAVPATQPEAVSAAQPTDEVAPWSGVIRARSGIGSVSPCPPAPC